MSLPHGVFGVAYSMLSMGSTYITGLFERPLVLDVFVLYVEHWEVIILVLHSAKIWPSAKRKDPCHESASRAVSDIFLSDSTLFCWSDDLFSWCMDDFLVRGTELKNGFPRMQSNKPSGPIPRMHNGRTGGSFL